MAKGKLVVIEGMDGTGKGTQSKLLNESLFTLLNDDGWMQPGAESRLISFPVYASPTGQKVRDYLNGNSSNLTIFERAKLYADDRLAHRDEMIDWLEQGGWIVCDRYVHSNVTYMAALAETPVFENLADTTATADRMKALADREFVTNKMPLPDVVIVLDLPPAVSENLVLQKGKRDYTDLKQDLHERDKDLQHKVRLNYQYLAKTNPEMFRLINCINAQGSMKSVESIQLTIQQIVKTL